MSLHNLSISSYEPDPVQNWTALQAMYGFGDFQQKYPHSFVANTTDEQDLWYVWFVGLLMVEMIDATLQLQPA